MALAGGAVHPCDHGLVTLACPADRPEPSRSAVPVLPGAEPFSADGGDTGVLLCHGFTGSPPSLRPRAEALPPPRHTGRPPPPRRPHGAAPPPARSRDDVAGHEPHLVATVVRRGQRCVHRAAEQVLGRVRRRAVHGWRARPAPRRAARRERRGPRAREPRRARPGPPPARPAGPAP